MVTDVRGYRHLQVFITDDGRCMTEVVRELCAKFVGVSNNNARDALQQNAIAIVELCVVEHEDTAGFAD